MAQDKYISLKENNPHQAQHLNQQKISHFTLRKKILVKENKGILLNGLVYRLPTRMRFSDSCPQGLGDFTHGGRGW